MRDACFLGSVAATAMHDMLNVLATIRELAGLMGDLLKSPAGKGFQQRDKFAGMLAVVEEQVVKGSALAEELNRFGHLPAGGEACDAARLARMLLTLLARRCKARGVRFHVEDARRPLHLGRKAFAVALAIHQVLEACMEALPREQSVRLSFERAGDDGAMTVFSSEAALAERLLADPDAGCLGDGIVLERAGQAARLRFPLERDAT